MTEFQGALLLTQLERVEAQSRIRVRTAAYLGELLEDVPGVGKTTLAKALAKSIDVSVQRVQFTPDLLPTDILGSSIYNPIDGTFCPEVPF